MKGGKVSGGINKTQNCLPEAGIHREEQTKAKEKADRNVARRRIWQRACLIWQDAAIRFRTALNVILD